MYAGWLMERLSEKIREYKLNHADIDKERKYRVVYKAPDGTFSISRPQVKKQAKSLFGIFNSDGVEIVKIIQRRKQTES